MLIYLLTELSKRELKAEADMNFNNAIGEDETIILPLGDKALI